MVRKSGPPVVKVTTSSAPTRIDVVPTGQGWQVKRVGAARASGSYSSQAEAIQAAQAKLTANGGELRIQGDDGRWRKTFTLGRSAMIKLSAVEGIALTWSMKRKIKAAQGPSLSAGERMAIASGKASR